MRCPGSLRKEKEGERGRECVGRPTSLQKEERQSGRLGLILLLTRWEQV